MKIFFAAPQAGTKHYNKYYKKIGNILTKLSYNNLDKSLVNDPFSKQKKDNCHQLLKKIQSADVSVFEVSFSSSFIGFLIAKSIELDKPTVIMYLNKNKAFFLSEIENEKLIIKKYSDDSLMLDLKEALTESHHKTDKRFNFFISSELLNYLHKISKKYNMTKSTFIRKLLLDSIKINPL